jgi:D-alanine-D-alanine ligase-like ATP-grasp enzyme
MSSYFPIQSRRSNLLSSDRIMSKYEITPVNHDNEPQVEVIGDEKKVIDLNVGHIKIKRVCIISIDPNYTIETVHGNNLAIPTSEKDQSHTVLYPHDTEQVLKELDPNITVQTIHLIPNARQSIATIRRLKHDIDVFINLYDNSDDTEVKIIEYMQNQGIAFTGSSLHFCDPTRIELKRLCRYNQLPTPKFALLTDLNNQTDDVLTQLIEKLGGFPLFVKPEHGFDSKSFSL